jgi:PAS domain S-box-containing protein
VFVATGVVISWLNHQLHVSRQAERSAAATAMARAERLDAILNMTLDGIIVIDAQGRIEAFNRGAQDLFGYPEHEVVGRNVSILMPSPDHEQHDSYLSRYLATGRAKIIGIGREVQGRRKDGTTFPLHLSVGEITIQGERRFTGILHDLTSRVQIEGRLREQEALAKLGEMAAVIAHEVKNPLAGIRGAIQVFGSRMMQEGTNAQIVTEIMARIDALDKMMKDLTPFFTTKSRGSGLGLPTVKRFVEAHNGQIAIDCPEAGGTTIVIRLPMGAA